MIRDKVSLLILKLQLIEMNRDMNRDKVSRLDIQLNIMSLEM